MLGYLFETKFIKINHGTISDWFANEDAFLERLVEELQPLESSFANILRLFSHLTTNEPSTVCSDLGETVMPLYRDLAAIRDMSLMITFYKASPDDSSGQVVCRIKIIDLDDKTAEYKLKDHQTQTEAIMGLISEDSFCYAKCM